MLSFNQGSSTVKVFNVDASKTFIPGDYIQVKDQDNNLTIVQIKTITSPGEISITSNWSQVDMESKGVYSLTNEAILNEEIADAMYSVELDIDAFNTSHILSEVVSTQIFYCHAEKCLEKAFLKLSNELCDECDTSTYIKELMLLESLISGVKYAKCCPNKEAVNKIFELISRLCSLNLCNQSL